MTQYNTLNVKLSNLQLNKLKFGIKYGTKVILILSSNLMGNYNNKTNFQHKILLTYTQICEAFANGSSVDKKIQKLNCLR